MLFCRNSLTCQLLGTPPYLAFKIKIDNRILRINLCILSIKKCYLYAWYFQYEFWANASKKLCWSTINVPFNILSTSICYCFDFIFKQWLDRMYSRSKIKWSTPTNSNANYRREIKLVPINMDYCLLQIGALKVFLGVRLHGGGSLYLTLIFQCKLPNLATKS